MRVFILDSTLHDGMQSGNISFGIDDKLAIAARLDEFGIDYVDAGWPAVDPRDREFFARARDLRLRRSKLVAFGFVRFPRNTVDNDPNIQAVLEAGTQAVCLSGESWDLHVFKNLQSGEADHLDSVRESVSFFKDRDREVIYNAEHFFDGYEANPDFALRTLEAAREAGADVLCLCDTAGGTLTSRLARICSAVKARFAPTGNEDVMLGIHAHNDADLAVANSIAAVEQGYTHVQGCFNGYGDRCGCANLSSIIPNLELKAGRITVGRDKLEHLNGLARFIAETANVPLPDDRPYVGASAFLHRGDERLSVVSQDAVGFGHTRPEYVGNSEQFLFDHLSDPEELILKLANFRLPSRLSADARRELLERIRMKEEEGYDLAAADGSFELLVRETLQPDARPFAVLHYEVTTRHTASDVQSAAQVTLECRDAVLNGAASGNGPVNALDLSLRQALSTVYASVRKVKLVDYRLRVLESQHGTDAKCRVLIHWSDGEASWSTGGVSGNIVEASWLALLDAVYLEILREQPAEAVAAADYSWAV